MSGDKTLRLLRLASLALIVASVVLIVWNWKASQWWELPAGLAAGYAVSIIIWCVIPPRFPLPWPWRGLATRRETERMPGRTSSPLRSCCQTDPCGGHRGTCQHSMMNGGNWDEQP